MKKITLSAIAALALCTSSAQAQWNVYPPFLAPGGNGIVALDLDGDGVDEAVVSGGGVGGTTPRNQFLAVVDYAPANGNRIVHERYLGPEEFFVGQILVHPAAGPPTIIGTTYTTSNVRYLTTFTGADLTRGPSVPVGDFVLHAIADIDADGILDAIGVTMSHHFMGNAQIRNLSTGTIKWTDTLRNAQYASAVQLDADAALEIVYGNQESGSIGYIIDGITQQVDWSWPSGFRGRTLTGNFDSNPATTEFAIVERWGYTRVFGTPSGFYQQISQFSTNEVDSVRAHDINADGIDDIVVGQGQRADVVAFTPTTWQRLFTYNNTESGVSALAVGNLDFDPALEVVYGAGLTSTGTDLVRVFDTATLTTQLDNPDVSGPHSSVVVADLDGNGTLEMAYATTAANSGHDGSRLIVLDAETGVQLRAVNDVLDAWDTHYGAQLKVANLDADSRMEIVIAGEHIRDGRIRVIDGVTLGNQWTAVVPGLAVQAIDLVELNGDGILDIVAAIDRRVHALNGASGALLWSTAVAGSVNRLTIAAGEADADASKEVLLGTGTSYHLFDAGTQTVQATYTASAEALGLAIEGSGADCRLVHFDPTQIVRRRCDTLTIDSTRPYAIATAVMVKPLTDSHGALLLSDGDALYVQDGATLSSDPVTELGPSLGWRNRGAVMRTGDVTSAFVGSATAVRRVEIVPDTTPSPFAFPDVSGLPTDIVVTSDETTIEDIRVPSPISVDGGSFSINGGPFQTAPGTVISGDRIRLRHVSSDDALTSVISTLDVGGVTGTFQSTTGSIDLTPDAFAFEDVIRARLSTWTPSNPVTFTGFNALLLISIVAQQLGDDSSETVQPAFSINGGPYTSSPAMIQPGDTVRVAMMSSPQLLTTMSAVITIGDRQYVWNVTTNER